MNRTPKRLLVVATVVAAVATTAGCAAGSSTTASGGVAKPIQFSSYCDTTCQAGLELKGNANDVDCTIGISLNSLGHPYGVAQKAAFEAAVRDYFPKMKFVTTDGQGDAVTQSSQVRDMITQGIKALVITPLETDSLAPVVKAAKDAGIPVIDHDRTVSTPVDTFIGADNVQAGRTAAQWVVDKLGSKGGNVVEVQGTLGASATIDRHKGMEEVFAENPNVKVVQSVASNYLRADAYTAMKDVLQRFGPGKIDVVYTQGDEMGLGVTRAIKEAGRESEISVLTFSQPTDDPAKMAELEQLAATVVYPLNSPEAIVAAAKACLGEKLPESVAMKAPVINQADIRKFLTDNPVVRAGS
ncbi:ribose transport system substrate-binding protein [Paenarthrobacter nicotinovorans]|uniref:Ribose transport system substrate-binding protein n=1 Tax=Paenarthrobacter nicotinovorans TaxID=29320 RepID=A0ABT9TRJ7_PAENI|nr:substrate-binding domain-containing protein [Paenarthrobacter nicotinovorans]MDQ0103077.1 ribose transport system substrate-binding protein [Paenarthrobacter nicotinovorans]GAT88405.1 hypothetical protein CVCC1112_3064 [Paenarthrobacter nicotinovorans]